MYLEYCIFELCDPAENNQSVQRIYEGEGEVAQRLIDIATSRLTASISEQCWGYCVLMYRSHCTQGTVINCTLGGLVDTHPDYHPRLLELWCTYICTGFAYIDYYLDQKKCWLFFFLVPIFT